MQTFTGREYLKIDVANNFGLDKSTWDERISWFDRNEHQLESLLSSADTPALFYAGVKAYRQVQAGEPIGYTISLDATSSGLQLLAVLTGDRSASEICNVISGPRGDQCDRRDAYLEIYQTMLAQVAEMGGNGTQQITREGCKEAIMASLYCSTAMPKRVFGEGRLLDTFYATMNDRAPAAWELKDAFLEMWNPNAFSNDWVLPDNYHVHVNVMDRVSQTVHFMDAPYDVHFNVNQPTQEGRSLGANVIHSIDGMVVRELSRRCMYDRATVVRIAQALNLGAESWGDRAETNDDQMVLTLWNNYEQSGYLSARILDHLQLENLLHVKDPSMISDMLASLPSNPFELISIHDCFRCLPHYGDDLRRQYNLQLQLIARSEMLSNLVSQIVGHKIHVGKLDPDLYIEVIDANYALS